MIDDAPAGRARETVFTVLGARAREADPRRLMALLGGANVLAAAVLLGAPGWWPLAMLPLALACYAAWGLLARWGAERAALAPSRRGASALLAGVRLLLATTGTVAGLLFPGGLLLMLYADLSIGGTGSGAKGGGGTGCYFNGYWHTEECPRPGRPAPVAAEVYAAVVDSLYFGLARQRPGARTDQVLIEERSPLAGELPDLAAVATRLGAELPGEGSALVEGLRAANAAPARHAVLVTVPARQTFLDSAAVGRFLSGGDRPIRSARDAAEAIAFKDALGVLTLSRPAVDPARRTALVFVGLRVRGAAPLPSAYAAAEYVLLRREDGAWRIVAQIAGAGG